MATESLFKTTTTEHLGAQLAPETFNAEANTLDVRFYSGATVLRGGFWTEPYELTFEMTADAADFSRLNAGAPFLLNHTATVQSTIGRVGSGRLGDGEALASIELVSVDDDPENASSIKKIQKGFAKGVSMGVDILERRIEQREGQMDLHTATRWQPFELSSAVVQADPDAATLAKDSIQGAPPRNPEEDVMSDNTKTDGAQVALDKEKAANEKLKAENKKQSLELAKIKRDDEITKTFASLKLSDADRDVMLAKPVENLDIGGARMEMLELATKKSEALGIKPQHGDDGITRDERETKRDGALNALLHRANPGKFDLDDNGKRFYGLSLIETTERVSGRSSEGEGRSRRAELAMSASDFPKLLAAGVNRTLGTAYEDASKTYQVWSTRRDLPDFKAMNIVRRSAAPALSLKAEGAPTVYGSMSETQQGWQLYRYSTGLAFTFEMMVNDDLGAFMDVAAALGASSARKENSLVYAHLAANPTMAEDSKALFHADHGNLAGAGAAPSQTTLNNAFVAVSRFTDIDAVAKINASPKFWLGGATTREDRAKALGLFNPSTASNVRPEYFDAMTNVTDAEITGNEWYCVMDPATVDTMRYGWLEGAQGPQVGREADFDTDDLKVKVTLNFGYRAVDFRGFYKNPGA